MDLVSLYKKAPYSFQKFYPIAKEHGYTRNDVREFLASRKSQETTYRTTGKKEFQRYETTPKTTQQCDILYMTGDFQDRGFKYILNVIDNGSRYALSHPLKGKTAKETARAIEKLQKEGMPGLPPLGIPQYIECDEGSEFKREFLRYCEQEHIFVKFGTPENIRDNALVERFNGTLSMLITRLKDEGYDHWSDVLPDILHSYNNSKHSTLKEKPIDVFHGRKQSRRPVPRVVANETPLPLLSDCKVLLPSKEMKRQYSDKWSDDTYTIGKVVKQRSTGIIMYRLFDKEDGHYLTKSYYRRELQPNVRRAQEPLREPRPRARRPQEPVPEPRNRTGRQRRRPQYLNDYV